MDPKNSTPSWCLVCRKRLTPLYTPGHSRGIPIILCLPESLPRFPYDHKREGHNGIYLHSPEASDSFRELDIPLSPNLTEFSFQEVDFRFPPIKDPNGRRKFNPVQGYTMPQVLEPVPQEAIQTLRITSSG